jgi:hypothetical protein
LGIVTPTDELIFFRGVGIPPTSLKRDRYTTNQLDDSNVKNTTLSHPQ